MVHWHQLLRRRFDLLPLAASIQSGGLHLAQSCLETNHSFAENGGQAVSAGGESDVSAHSARGTEDNNNENLQQKNDDAADANSSSKPDPPRKLMCRCAYVV